MHLALLGLDIHDRFDIRLFDLLRTVLPLDFGALTHV